jgi:hypothetical protein
VLSHYFPSQAAGTGAKNQVFRRSVRSRIPLLPSEREYWLVFLGQVCSYEQAGQVIPMNRGQSRKEWDIKQYMIAGMHKGRQEVSPCKLKLQIQQS